MSWTKILETGKETLIGVDDEVTQYELSNSFGYTIPVNALPKNVGGELYQFTLLMTESGTGTLQAITGQIIVLDADPDASAGDTDLTAVEWGTVIGVIDVEEADWIVETNAAIACITDKPLAFHACDALYFVWRHTDADALNSVAGDDYKLELNAWLRLGG